MKSVYLFNVNLDERGMFDADVLDASGNAVFKVLSDNETGEVNAVVDGYMEYPEDLDGLTEYLILLGVIEVGSVIRHSDDAETETELGEVYFPELI